MSIEETQAEKPRIGDTLRLAREARDMTLSDVSKALQFREDYLQAIENMYANGVPKGYLSGILRSYAGFLGLPAEEAVKTFAEQCGAVSQSEKIEVISVAPATAPSRLWRTVGISAAALALVGIGGVGMMLISGKDAPVETIVEAGSPVSGAHESLFARATPDELAAQLPLTLTAQSAAWLEVRGADGTIFRSRKMASGETYHPRIGAGWTVTARNGGAFVWTVGDIEIGPLGEVAAPVFSVSVDAVAVEAQAITAPALASAVSDGKPAH